ncbi:hypothetical protein BCV69DRAFT_37467 [Microstroma glucosiphilum]|uniref:Stealth protein CR3 conserved region 3 domain-containing protein n=1 Tax=Pseudomicrostroma glucosiphilum TaxID=1684307 RepID=A0A316U3K5_9BASI|nr:hypothetical protein BCV69DRAFT_37467 [Pseudomicrostroma glucosiphilum]PWN19374.1 hypothetical protein BCV69DRAFT_37467 [Pseudomicrostroma glucosiphilum]
MASSVPVIRGMEEEQEVARFLLERSKRRQEAQAAGFDRPYSRRDSGDDHPEKSSLLGGARERYSEGWDRPGSRRRGPPARIVLLGVAALCLSSAWVLYTAFRYALSDHAHENRWRSETIRPAQLRRPNRDRLANDPNMPPLRDEAAATGPMPDIRIDPPTDPLPFTFPPLSIRRRIEPVLEYEPIVSNSDAIEAWISNGVVSPSIRYPNEHPTRRYDVVISSVNGSDWEHRRQMLLYKNTKAPIGKVFESWPRLEKGKALTKKYTRLSKRTDGDAGENRFREIDELRYSARSAYHSLQDLSKIHLLIPSFFPPAPFDQPGSAGDKADSAPDGWEALQIQRSTFATESGRQQWGQLPQWLLTNHTNVLTGSQARLESSARAGNGNQTSVQLRVHHDWNLFEPNWLVNATLADTSRNALADWKEQVLPTFNSIAVESMLGSEGMAGLGDTFIHANDDMFFGPGLTSTSFSSPLFGPIIRLDPNLPVYGAQVSGPRSTGEWPSLEHSAWLLDQRFGKRARPYVLHVPRVYKTSLLRELRMTFAPSWRLTGEARFRNEDLQNRPELSTHFLAAHFVVERYREAMLWSFFILKMDENSDGYLSAEELSNHLLRRLGIQTSINSLADIQAQALSLEVWIPFPYRSALDDNKHVQSLQSLGLLPPGKTTFEFTASEGGYPYMTLHPFVHERPPPRPKYAGMGSKLGQEAREPWPRYHPREGKNRKSDGRFDRGRMATKVSIAGCMSGVAIDEQGRMKTEDVFKAWTFGQGEKCGDAIIVHLLSASGAAGMAAALPPADKMFPGVASNATHPQEPHLPLTPHWDRKAVPNESSLWTGEEAQERVLTDDVPDFSLASISARQSWSGLSQRAYAQRLLMRYQYTLAASPTEFYKLSTDFSTKQFFDSFNMDNVGFLCLNDDYRNDHVGRMRYQFQKWAKVAFPSRSPFENDVTDKDEEGPRLMHLQKQTVAQENLRQAEEAERKAAKKELQRVEEGKRPRPAYIGKG